MKKIILLLSIGLSLQQCKKDLPIIDSKTEITFNSSFDEIAKKLPSLQQEKLKEALYIIYEYNTKAKTTEARWAIVRQLLDGKNSDEIFTLAETLAKENGFSWNRNQALILEVFRLWNKKLLQKMLLIWICKCMPR